MLSGSAVDAGFLLDSNNESTTKSRSAWALKRVGGIEFGSYRSAREAESKTVRAESTSLVACTNLDLS